MKRQPNTKIKKDKERNIVCRLGVTFVELWLKCIEDIRLHLLSHIMLKWSF